MTLSYFIPDLNPINKFLKSKGITPITEQNNTSKAIIEELEGRKVLDKFIFGIIKERLSKYIENQSIEELTKNRVSIQRETKLRMPQGDIFNRNSLILLFLLTIIVYSILTYLYFYSYDMQLFLINFFNISAGFIVSLLLWGIILKFFPNSIGRMKFNKISNSEDLVNEVYILNYREFIKDDYRQLHILIKQMCETYVD